MALEQKRRYRADGTLIDEKGDRSVVDDVAVEEQGGLSVPKNSIPPTREQQVRPVAPPQVAQLPAVNTTAMQPTQVAAQPQPVNVAPVEVGPQQVDGATLPQPPAQASGVPEVSVDGGSTGSSTQGGVVQGAAPEVASDANTSSVPTPQAQNVEQQTTTTEETPKAPLFKGDPALQKQYEAEVNSWDLNGNVDMYNRPMVSADKMHAAGYDVPDGETSTIYTISWSIGDPVKNGKYKSGDGKSYAHNLIMTPILANGDVWSQDQLAGYWDKLIKKAGGNPQKALELDKQLAKVIVGIDTPEGIEHKIHDAHEKYYLGGGQPQNGKNTTNANVSAGSTVQGSTDNASAVEAATRKAMEEYNDLFLSKIIQSNSGKDSPNAKLVVKLAGDILKSRGKKLPTVTSAKSANGANEDGEAEDVDNSKPSAEDVQRNINNLEQIINDKDATATAKKEAEQRLAEWKKVAENMPQKNSSGSGLKDDDKLHDGKTVKEYKEMHKDSSKETIKMILDATRGLDGYDNDVKALEDLYREKGGVLEPPKKAEAPEMKLEDMDNYNKAVADAKKAQDELDAAMKNKGSYRAVALAENKKSLEDAGLTEEDEKRIEKRHRTQRIIANIGDILQGFANLAGTWYGANSSKLTSLSGAVGEAQKEVRAEREKRREKLEKNYQDLLTQLKKDGDTDIAQRVAALKAANDRVNKITDNFYTEQHKSRNRKKEQEHATEEYGKRQQKLSEESGKREAKKTEERIKQQNNQGKVKQGEVAARIAGQAYVAQVRGAESRKTAAYKKSLGGSGKGSKKGKSGGKRKSKGTVHG